MAVRVQSEDFDLGSELSRLRIGSDIGAVVSFTGIVRANADETLQALELECYPGMVEKALQNIESQAISRWALKSSLIIHRIGKLAVGEQIMMVATASGHRKDAFDAAEFLMDYLKSRAPFWKKEHFADGQAWVQAIQSDEDSLKRW